MIPSTISSGVRVPGSTTNNATIDATNASRTPVATRLLTSTPASSNGSFMSPPSCRPVQSLDGGDGAPARHPVGIQNVGDVVDVPGAGVERLGGDGGDGRPGDAALEERRDRDLVGAAKHRGRAAPRPARLEREAQAREGVE